MAFGISTNATLAINPETTWGTPLTTGAKYLRVTGFNNKPEVGYIESDEINSAHRETADSIKASAKGGGSVDFEMSFNNIDSVMESVLGNAFSTLTLIAGKTLKSFTLQEQYTDLTTAFQVYAGCVANSLSLDVAIGQPIKGSFGFVSKVPTVGVATAVGTVAAANTNPVMNPLNHISLIQQGGSSITGCQSFSLQFQNDITEIPQLSSADVAALLLGRLRVSGSFSVFKQATARVTAMLADADTSLALTIGETTRTYAITLGKVRITSVEGGAQGSNPILERFNFTGLYESAVNSTVKIIKGS